ncbi:hypothetical protein GCM10027563_31390 [Parasphingorhabdus pacifica]
MRTRVARGLYFCSLLWLMLWSTAGTEQTIRFDFTIRGILIAIVSIAVRAQKVRRPVSRPARADQATAHELLEPCAARKIIVAGGSGVVLSGWKHVQVIVSLLSKVTRELLSVPSALLRRGTTKHAALLVLLHENRSCAVSLPTRSAMTCLPGITTIRSSRRIVGTAG